MLIRVCTAVEIVMIFISCVALKCIRLAHEAQFWYESMIMCLSESSILPLYSSTWAIKESWPLWLLDCYAFGLAQTD